MSNADQPPISRVDQSQQRGGLSLGAYNSFQELKIGDVIAGDKVTIQTFQLIVYIGDARPSDPAMRADLLRAYRSEVAARYAVWRRRYAALPLVAQPLAAPRAAGVGYEREDLTFVALRRAFGPETEAANRPEASEALAPHTFTDLRDGLTRDDHLLLLGPPGGGKTTALWRLALDLAETGLAGNEAVALPVFVRLGGLQPGQSIGDLLRADLATAAFEDAAGLRFPLNAHRAIAALLDDLLAEGRMTLLWDGLNEVPSSRFAEIARALDLFRREHPGRIAVGRNASVTTCRADDHALLLEECDADPYPVQRVIVQGLDRETMQQIVVGRLGAERGAQLLRALDQPEHAGLAGLARTPLLLTMLGEVYDAAGALPRNRGQLLQQFVAQRWAWEQRRRPEGWIAAEVQQRALAGLAYAITASAGRGTAVPRPWAEQQLRATGGAADPAALLRLGRAADLVEPLADGGQIRFTHQLVQEYFAAVALQAKLQEAQSLQAIPMFGGLAKQQMLRRYARPGARTGWEETLLLLAGVEGDAGAARALIRSFVAQPLKAARLLEAEGATADPGLRDEVRDEALRQVADPTPGWRRRLEAGSALGLLGDPRFPVRDAEWQESLAQLSHTLTGAGEHYWRYVPAGRYRIGGWDKGQQASDHSLSAFWVARLPVTVAQLARFVAEGYREDRHWTPNGLPWRGERIAPRLWGDSGYSGANQAVVGVSWYEATAFCHWLREQLREALPAGYELRLPSEAEWEAAAAYAGPQERREYPWGPDAATPERAVYDAWKLNAPAPAGLCPAGAAACGALDMAGNVWEWTTSSHKGYPAQSNTLTKDFTDSDIPLRGHAYYGSSTNVRCGARNWFPPDYWNYGYGFRVVVSPPLAQTS